MSSFMRKSKLKEIGLSLCASAILTMGSISADPNDGLYQGGALKVGATSIQDSLGSYDIDRLDDVTPKHPSVLKNTTPLMQRLWKIALNDCEMNIVTNELGTYFGAGARYGARVYTRDIAFAGVLGTNDLYPEIMMESMRITRKVRFDLGYKVSKPHVISEIDAPWEVIAETDKEVMMKYKTNCYTRRTDDVIWIWAVDDLFEKHPEIADWKWFYEAGVRSFTELYDPWYDKSDGLYIGQPTFQDLTHTSYPDNSSIADCVLVKSGSTNALYYKALLAMANAAKQTGQTEKVQKQWLERAASLRLAFRRHLIMPDGGVTYYLDRYGRMMPNQHNLGTGLAVIFGVLQGEEAKRAYETYPTLDVGIPLIHTILGGQHGLSQCGIMAILQYGFLVGKEIATGESFADYNAALLARSIGTKIKVEKRKKNKNSAPEGDWNGGFGSFHEKIELPSGLIGGSGHQLWSSSAFLNVFLRHGQVNINP